jgi:hypothetical protein
MFRKSALAVLVLAAVTAAHAGERGPDRAAVREPLPRFASPWAAPLFAMPQTASVETADGVSASAGPFEVILVRIGEDGKPVLDCVDNEVSARRFFERPAARLATTAAQER